MSYNQKSSVDAHRSLNCLILNTLHTTYACLPCQGKVFKKSYFPMLFSFIFYWFSFPDSVFLCPPCVTVIEYLNEQEKRESEFIVTGNQLTIQKGVWIGRFKNTLFLSRQSW